MHKFHHKKIGIWGFGVVGKAAFDYFAQYNPASITILDQKEIIPPASTVAVTTLIQNTDTIHQFLKEQDYILASPGIPLHQYEPYLHKFVHEVDLFFEQTNTRTTIAITGSFGKTSITHVLTHLLQADHPATQALGNIGYPLLKTISSPMHTQLEYAILELSSFQLQHTHQCKPNLAIITNLHPNHLDHHQSMDEYCLAKCKIWQFQRASQHALLPVELVPTITKQFAIQPTWIFFHHEKPDTQLIAKYRNHTIYFLENNKIMRLQNGHADSIFDINTLPAITFPINWLIIIAALDILDCNLTNIAQATTTATLPDHRLQKIATIANSDFYNDSKSTTWQTTLAAVQTLHSKPIKLFVGGLSKGADRAPLFTALQGKDIEIYLFGKEHQELAAICAQLGIKHAAHPTLEAAFAACMNNLQTPTDILFSPGGSSYDLFKDYQERGRRFVQLVEQYQESHL